MKTRLKEACSYPPLDLDSLTLTPSFAKNVF